MNFKQYYNTSFYEQQCIHMFQFIRLEGDTLMSSFVRTAETKYLHWNKRHLYHWVTIYRFISRWCVFSCVYYVKYLLTLTFMASGNRIWTAKQKKKYLRIYLSTGATAFITGGFNYRHLYFLVGAKIYRYCI